MPPKPRVPPLKDLNEASARLVRNDSSKPIRRSIPTKPTPSSRIAPRTSPRPPTSASPPVSSILNLTPPPPRAPRLPSSVRTALTATTSIFFASITLLFIRDNIVTMDIVRGSSMAPTLSPNSHETGENERVIIKRWMPGRDLKRGDIVTFWKPHRRGEVSIKRVVGLEGDEISVGRGRNGNDTFYGKDQERRLASFDGLGDELEDGSILGRREEGKVVVPHGHIWVEGDNWRKSYDSNDFGPISRALVDGKAVRVLRGGWFRAIEDKRGKKDDEHACTVTREGNSEIPGFMLE